MKKIISTILSLTLVLGLIPTMGITASAEKKILASDRQIQRENNKVDTIKEITIENLDAPYNGSALDKEITLQRSLQTVSVKYTMFNKEFDSYSLGDDIAIVVRVKTRMAIMKIDADSRAYWKEQDVYSDLTNIISDNEAEYVFHYKVPEGDAPHVQTAHFNVSVPKEGEAFSTEVTHPLSPGVNVQSVEWIPADEKADASKEYTVKINFGKNDAYVWAKDFEDQAVVTINGKYAPLNRVEKGKFFYYSTEATIKPEPADDSTENIKKDEAEKPDESEKTDKTDKIDKTDKEDNVNNNVKPVSYKFPFTDVPSKQWYYESVKSAHKMGLINGKTATIYAPDDNMTYAEAVKLAVCMNILYNGGDPRTDISMGTDLWYSTYMKYALENGIIDDDLTLKADEKIVRKEYAYIFSKALPEKAFAAKNNIPSGSIPDVKEEKLAQDKAVYLLYRAGVLGGNDAKGTFNPSANIKRSEVAAILIRMMDASTRVNAPAELGK